LNIDIEIIGERSMTRTSNTFGALALTILTVFALWTSTLTVPAAAATTTTAAAGPIASPVIGKAAA
jgi:hypothetical protein